MVVPDPGGELRIGERPNAGLVVSQPEPFQPSQRGLDTPGRRYILPESNSQRTAKFLTKRPVGAMSERLRRSFGEQGDNALGELAALEMPRVSDH